jgi:glutamate dehydrogenase
MLLTEDEFFDNKEQIVAEVLDKVRSLSKMEALLLFREYDTYPGSLPEVSQIISNAINVATDVLTEALDHLTEAELDSLLPLFR